MAIPKRMGEHGAAHERSTRFLQKGNYWYYTTREGVDIGPFDCREDAELGASEFIHFIRASEPKMLDILKQYRAA